METNDPARDLLGCGLGVFERGGFPRARVAAESTRLEGLVVAALPKYGQEAVGRSVTVTRWPEHSR